MTFERLREVGRKEKDSNVFSYLMRAREKRVVEKTDLAASQRCTIKGQWIVITVCSKGNSSWP